VFFIRCPGVSFGNTMHQRFCLLELASMASGKQALTFLFTMTAEPEPSHTAAIMGGDAMQADAAFLDAISSAAFLAKFRGGTYAFACPDTPDVAPSTSSTTTTSPTSSVMGRRTWTGS
jgi:hypothetical protein